MPKIAKKRATPPTQVEIDFIKSNLYRVVRGDGVFGGLTPNGSIHLGIYSERVPYPQKIFHEVHDGLLQPENTSLRQGRSANVLRELEVGVSMDIAQAMVLRTWLDDKISQYQQIVGPLPEVPAAPTVNFQASKKTTKNGKHH